MERKSVDHSVFGKNMHVRMFSLSGRCCVDNIKKMIAAITGAIGMNTEGMAPGIWRYPAAGLGGVGHTIVQPITESFIAVDSWDDHNGLYLLIVSCREFEDDDLLEQTISEFYKIEQKEKSRLGLA